MRLAVLNRLAHNNLHQFALEKFDVFGAEFICCHNLCIVENGAEFVNDAPPAPCNPHQASIRRSCPV